MVSSGSASLLPATTSVTVSSPVDTCYNLAADVVPKGTCLVAAVSTAALAPLSVCGTYRLTPPATVVVVPVARHSGRLLTHTSTVVVVTGTLRMSSTIKKVKKRLLGNLL